MIKTIYDRCQAIGTATDELAELEDIYETEAWGYNAEARAKLQKRMHLQVAKIKKAADLATTTIDRQFTDRKKTDDQQAAEQAETDRRTIDESPENVKKRVRENLKKRAVV